MQGFQQLPGHWDTVKSNWAARAEAVSSSMSEDRTLVSLIESRPFGSTCWLLWCAMSISDRVMSKRRAARFMISRMRMVSKNSPLVLQRRSEIGEWEGEKQNNTQNIYMYLKAPKDVHKPLFMTPGKGRKFDIWLFFLCLPCTSVWKLPGMNELRVTAQRPPRALRTGTENTAHWPVPSFPTRGFLPFALHLNTKKEKMVFNSRSH